MLQATDKCPLLSAPTPMPVFTRWDKGAAGVGTSHPVCPLVVRKLMNWGGWDGVHSTAVSLGSKAWCSLPRWPWVAFVNLIPNSKRCLLLKSKEGGA